MTMIANTTGNPNSTRSRAGKAYSCQLAENAVIIARTMVTASNTEVKFSSLLDDLFSLATVRFKVSIERLILSEDWSRPPKEA